MTEERLECIFLNDAFSSQVHYFVSPRVVTVHIYTIKERQNIEDKTASNRAVLRQRRPELPQHLARPGHTVCLKTLNVPQSKKHYLYTNSVIKCQLCIQ